MVFLELDFMSNLVREGLFGESFFYFSKGCLLEILIEKPALFVLITFKQFFYYCAVRT